MSGEIFYQWQNEHLLHTIYPLREMKLRDFLLHYQEIDLWAAYKEKKIQDIPEEVTAFRAAQIKMATSSQTEFDEFVDYFQGNSIRFGQTDEPSAADPAILDKLRKEHINFEKYFINYDSTSRQKIYLGRYTRRVESIRKKIQNEILRNERNIRNVPKSRKIKQWRRTIRTMEQTLPIVDSELNRLYAFSSLFQKIKAQRDDLAKWISVKKKERQKIESELRWKSNFVRKYPINDKTQGFIQDIADLKQQLHQIEDDIRKGMTDSIEMWLKEQVERQEITINDIVRWQTEKYQQEIAALDHEQLIEEIVKRFLATPQRYPLWLQYMVIHFSGMRYRSAHGSWGDPKDLLLSLRIKDIHAEVKQINDEEILLACAQEAGTLRSALEPGKDHAEAEVHIRRLESHNPYQRRRALLDFRIDREKQLIENMSEEESLQLLENLKDQLPQWMWKEIVERTPLRLKFATENWETLTPEERSDYLDRESQIYREVMIEWKRKHLTGWREEHDRSNRLIVSRAVCNEVAEHIQHLRGHTPPGGLTAKPDWYLRKEKSADHNPADPPFLIKPKHAEDFKPGASILWLRWVKNYPNPWRIAPPRTLKNGEGLLPAKLLGRVPANIKKALGNSIPKIKGNTSKWVYEIKGNAFRRSRVRIDEIDVTRKKKKKKEKKTILARILQQEWLRWMHEATVVEVAETADGPVVLTFETALPYDDPRRSTIGIFKRSVRSLRYFVSDRTFNGVFVGYVPEAEVPEEDLRAMLNWNQILQKEDFLSAADDDAYWDQMLSP